MTEANVETPPAGNDTPPESNEGAGQADDRDAEIARLREALKSANGESAQRRRRLEELEAAEAARQQAEMTELEKERKRAQDAEERASNAEKAARETLIRAAFVAEAARVGAVHPEDVYLLADRSAVDCDGDGKVSGVAEAVKVLVDSGRIPVHGVRPAAPSLDGGAGGGDRGSGAGKTVKLTQDELQTARLMGLTAEQYAAQKAAIAKESQE